MFPVGLSVVVDELDAFEELEGISVERVISLYLSITIKVRSYLVLKVDSLGEILNPTSLALGAQSRIQNLPDIPFEILGTQAISLVAAVSYIEIKKQTCVDISSPLRY